MSAGVFGSAEDFGVVYAYNHKARTNERTGFLAHYIGGVFPLSPSETVK
jgi:hypothetical protein